MLPDLRLAMIIVSFYTYMVKHWSNQEKQDENFAKQIDEDAS